MIRKVESLPEAQVYQVLDYIEFLDSKYGSPELEEQTSGLQRFAEGLEDRLRNRSFNPSNLREAFQVVAAADRALSGVAKAGRQILDEIAGGPDSPGGTEVDAGGRRDMVSEGDDETDAPAPPEAEEATGGTPRTPG